MELLVSSGGGVPSAEVVECKLAGHPDTLADDLAEHLSMVYSIASIERTERIWNHNFDKVGVLGGHCVVEFGGGELIRPIRVLLNGRFTPLPSCGAEPDIREILRSEARQFLLDRLEAIGPGNLVILDELSTAPSPGGIGSASPRQSWFGGFDSDALDQRQLLCNDTAVGVGFAPLTHIERRVLEFARTFDHMAEQRDGVGSDIKLLVAGESGEFRRVVAAIPAVSLHTNSLADYLDHRAKRVQELSRFFDCDSVTVNGRDRDSVPEIYLTLTGSSIESGDEGLVGRGNRACGFNPLTRGQSLEADRGKHPIYHTGRVYNSLASAVASRLVQQTSAPCAVTLVGVTGRKLRDPAVALVDSDAGISNQRVLETIADVLDTRSKALRQLFDQPGPDAWQSLRNLDDRIT